MTTTFKADIIVPEILAESMRGKFAGMNLLYGTGAVTVNPTLRAIKQNVGEKVKVPYWGTIGELDIIPEGAALTPRKMTQTSEEAIVQHAGVAIGISEWASIAAADDPYAEARRQILDATTRTFDNILIEKAKASLPSMTVDGYTSGKVLDYLLGVNTKQKFGDEGRSGDFVLWGIHSKTEGDLLTDLDAVGRPRLVDGTNGSLSRFIGIPVMVSDKLAPVSDKYTSLLIKRGALTIWVNPNVTINIDPDRLADDNIMTMHVYFVAHRYTRTADGTKPGVALCEHK